MNDRNRSSPDQQGVDENSPCPTCQGTGYRLFDEGGVTRAAPCPCQTRKDSSNLQLGMGIPSRYRHCELDNFDVLHQSQQQAKELSRRFVEYYPAVDRGLLFMGQCGVGKTHLAVGILRQLAVDRRVQGRFVDFHELLMNIRNSYNPVSRTSEMDLLGPVCNAELLVLDDLGAEKPSLWVQDMLHYILNQRYNGRRTTLITTNFLDGSTAGEDRRGNRSADETLEERIGYRLRSRLHEMCSVVRIEGEDFRSKVLRHP